LALALNQIPGVVENGLFINLCDRVIIGHTDGRVVVRDNHDGSVDASKGAVAPLDNIFADLGE
jgi:ribose 5-phosphate isomerase A